MQKVVALVVLLGLVSVINALNAITPGSTISQPQNYTFSFSGQIGQNNTYTTGYTGSYLNNNFDDLLGLSYFAQSNYSNVLGGPGLFTCDEGFDRMFFFNQNNLNAPSSYNIVFGAPNGSESGDYGYYAVDYSPYGVYALLNNDRIYYWNFSMINLAVSNAYPSPSYVFGNTSSSTTTGTQYAGIGEANSIAIKKTNGDIFVADYYCSRVLGYRAGNAASGVPYIVLGQNDYTTCDDTCDYTTEGTTCLSNPTYIAFDSYDGLWVQNSGVFLYFPNNSRVATFVFNTTDDISSNFDDGYGFALAPSNNYMVYAGYYQTNYVIYIVYNTVAGVYQPVQAFSVATFGGAYGSTNIGNGNTDYSNTGGLQDNQRGVAISNNTLFLSDYERERVVELSLATILAGVQSSTNPGSTQSANVGPTGSSFASQSISRSYIPLSSGASQSTSPSVNLATNTATATFTGEAVSESNSPIYYYTGAASPLNSWVNLF